jgi:hypothetical protein
MRFVIFERMITPSLLIFLYWLSVLFFIGYGIVSIIFTVAAMVELARRGGAREGNLVGLAGICLNVAIMIIGPIVTRVYFEILIVIFRINQTLIEIRDKVRK